jgi:hypothetical protein
MNDTLIAALIGAGIALSGIVLNHRLALWRDRRNRIDEFAADLGNALAALSDPLHRQQDAFDILLNRFGRHHALYLSALPALGWLNRRRLAAAWQQYYGEEGEQEWWLANEYSSLNSNRLDTTPDETRLRAIHHLNSLMKICA